jgi:hypothetical protein
MAPILLREPVVRHMNELTVAVPAGLSTFSLLRARPRRASFWDLVQRVLRPCARSLRARAPSCRPAPRSQERSSAPRSRFTEVARPGRTRGLPAASGVGLLATIELRDLDVAADDPSDSPVASAARGNPDMAACRPGSVASSRRSPLAFCEAPRSRSSVATLLSYPKGSASDQSHVPTGARQQC